MAFSFKYERSFWLKLIEFVHSDKQFAIAYIVLNAISYEPL